MNSNGRHSYPNQEPSTTDDNEFDRFYEIGTNATYSRRKKPTPRRKNKKMTENRVTAEQVKAIMENTTFHIQTVLGKCTIVTAQLPNGFILVESSACVDPVNYDEELGAQICKDRIEDKIWLLEGYKLQSKQGVEF